MSAKPGDVNAGEKALHFLFPDEDNKETRLSEFKGRWVVLYFYPRDNTSGCTREAVEFTSALDEFEKLNTILGVSTDSVESHQEFAEKHRLKVRLLSDEAPNSGTPVGTAF